MSHGFEVTFITDCVSLLRSGELALWWRLYTPFSSLGLTNTTTTSPCSSQTNIYMSSWPNSLDQLTMNFTSISTMWSASGSCRTDLAVLLFPHPFTVCPAHSSSSNIHSASQYAMLTQVWFGVHEWLDVSLLLPHPPSPCPVKEGPPLWPKA